LYYLAIDGTMMAVEVNDFRPFGQAMAKW